MLRETLKPKLLVSLTISLDLLANVIEQALEGENTRLRRLLDKADSSLSSQGTVETTMLPNRTSECGMPALDIEV